jgi:plasmid stabilization system protein ParE/plasmid maintenance system killer protein
LAYRVFWIEIARDDLSGIVYFIAKDNQMTAERFGLELIERAEAVSQFPQMDRQVPKIANSRIRREFLCAIWRRSASGFAFGSTCNSGSFVLEGILKNAECAIFRCAAHGPGVRFRRSVLGKEERSCSKTTKKGNTITKRTPTRQARLTSVKLQATHRRVTIRNFTHKGLKRLYSEASTKGVPPDTVDKLRKMLVFLDSMEDPEELRALTSWKAPHVDRRPQRHMEP